MKSIYKIMQSNNMVSNIQMHSLSGKNATSLIKFLKNHVIHI